MPRNSSGPRPIRGNNRDNTLNETASNDVMDGSGRDDVLISSRGNDTTTGGPGADTFVFTPPGGGGTVTITDFEEGVDLLDISAFGFDSQGGSALFWGNLETWGNDTHIVFYDFSGEALRVVLEDIHHTQISIDDYIL